MTIYFNHLNKVSEQNQVGQQQITGLPIADSQPLSSGLKTSEIPAHNFKAYVNFTGRYDPLKKELEPIIGALKGWMHKPEMMGPSYFSSQHTESAIFDMLHRGSEIPTETLQSISADKATVSNFNAITSSGSVKKAEDFIPETIGFVETLKKEVGTLTKTFDQLGFSEQEHTIFHQFVAKTATVLHNMGFPDAISHAAQVSRKCAIEASKAKATNSEVLQSAMVGWLHDPKLPKSVSHSNLATHPQIGGAIAHEVMFKDGLKALTVGDTHFNWGKHINRFKMGILESLYVNNDSAWVLENVILNQLPIPGAEKGIADLIPEAKAIALERFNAPAKGFKPEIFTPELEAKIRNTKFDTGLKGIAQTNWERACSNLSEKHPILKERSPSKIFDGIMDGSINNPDLIKDLRDTLKANYGINSPKVSGMSLFCHHDEVIDGKVAARSLAISDPLLLSPHKILASGFEKTPIARITSFIDSFHNNVDSLPQNAKGTGIAWSNDLLRSMLASADELTNGSTLAKFNAESSHLGLAEQNAALEKVLKSPETWGNFATTTITPETQGQLTKMSEILKKHYDKAAENSEGMFKIN